MNFRAIYDEHAGFVFRTLSRFGVADRMLPDAVQEVFTVAFRSLDRFEGRSSMKTWLFGIARRVASDMRRSAAARHEVLDESETPREIADPDSKSNVAVWAEKNEALARAETLLGALPEEQRIVFALFRERRSDRCLRRDGPFAPASRARVHQAPARGAPVMTDRDPKRWREEGGAMASLVADLARIEPSDEMRDRVWAKLAPIVPPPGGSSGGAGGGGGGGSMLGAKTLGPLLGAAIAGGIAIWALKAPPPKSEPIAVAPTTPISVVTTVPSAPPTLSAEPSVPASIEPPAPSAKPAPRPSAKTPASAAPLTADRLREEAEGVRKVRQLLREKNASAALAELDRLAKLVPNGPLEEEREVLSIEALAASGDRAAARRRAERFLFERPQSVHAARVRSFSRPE
jgi:RNA polymerase sigma-70 factor (ECF subfamily)